MTNFVEFPRNKEGVVVMDYVAMGLRIRNLRKRYGLTQAQLAERIGLSCSYMGHIERGSRIVSLETLVKLSEVLDASLDWLVTGAEPQEPAPGTRRVRILNDVMRVLDKHAEEWLRE